MSKKIAVQARKDKSKQVFFIKSDNNSNFSKDAANIAVMRELYVVRTDDEIVNRYSESIDEFIDQDGFFILISDDKLLWQNFRISLVNELCYGYDNFKITSDTHTALPLLHTAVHNNKKPFIFLETHVHKESTLEFLRTIRKDLPKARIIVVSNEIARDQLFLFHEVGIEGFLLKPASPNAIIQKIAFVLNPQYELDALILEGQRCLELERFDDAIDVARSILAKKPGSPAGLLIMGDALKGLCKRNEALQAYKTASENARLFLKPLKRIVEHYLEENDEEKALGYLKKIDKISPLNLDRKIQIARIYLNRDQDDAAQEYFTAALRCAKTLGSPNVACELTLSIASMLIESKPLLALAYYKQGLKLSKESSHNYQMTVFNRIGITLRRNGYWEQALEAYQEAEAIAPEDENIQYNMALVYFEGEQFDNARQRIDQALALNDSFHNHDSHVLKAISRIYQEAGDNEKAAKFLALSRQENINSKSAPIIEHSHDARNTV